MFRRMKRTRRMLTHKRALYVAGMVIAFIGINIAAVAKEFSIQGISYTDVLAYVLAAILGFLLYYMGTSGNFRFLFGASIISFFVGGLVTLILSSGYILWFFADITVWSMWFQAMVVVTEVMFVTFMSVGFSFMTGFVVAGLVDMVR
ncbi:MAG: hypothetical protein SV377_06715 [Halobacteria archaeon]|nr:hypothetical protein [Halobacteria archaeon]